MLSQKCRLLHFLMDFFVREKYAYELCETYEKISAYYIFLIELIKYTTQRTKETKV